MKTSKKEKTQGERVNVSDFLNQKRAEWQEGRIEKVEISLGSNIDNALSQKLSNLPVPAETENVSQKFDTRRAFAALDKAQGKPTVAPEVIAEILSIERELVDAGRIFLETSLDG
jgi:hypothetical protein